VGADIVVRVVDVARNEGDVETSDRLGNCGDAGNRWCP